MKKILFLYLLLGASFWASAQTLQLASGTVERWSNFPSRFVSARHVDVWLPASYTPQKRYAVLYMHDGQMLFDSTTTWNRQEWGVDETMSALMDDKKIKDCIVVGIWNSGPTRHIDYFPQKPFEALPATYRDSLISHAKRNPQTPVFAGEPISDGYLAFIVKELKPVIDSVYSTRKDRANTFIAGSSMGGLISMYAFCEYPEVFGGAACLSTHWPGIFTVENNPIPDAFLAYLEGHLPSPKGRRIYFDFGTATLDALYEPFQVKADDILRRKGYKKRQWITKKWEGEDHSERAWRKRLAVPLVFLLGQ